MDWPDKIDLADLTKVLAALAKESGCKVTQHRPTYRIEEGFGSHKVLNVPMNHCDLVMETLTHKAFYRSIMKQPYTLWSVDLKGE